MSLIGVNSLKTNNDDAIEMMPCLQLKIRSLASESAVYGGRQYDCSKRGVDGSTLTDAVVDRSCGRGLSR